MTKVLWDPPIVLPRVMNADTVKEAGNSIMRASLTNCKVIPSDNVVVPKLWCTYHQWYKRSLQVVCEQGFSVMMNIS